MASKFTPSEDCNTLNAGDSPLPFFCKLFRELRYCVFRFTARQNLKVL
jgi:hypothetical protein